MTAERDGKSRGTAQPDLLASLPNAGPAPGIDPAAIQEVRTAVQDLRKDFAGLREAVSAARPAPVTPEALEAWGAKLVARVAEAAQTADAPAEDKVVAAALHTGRIEDAAAKAEAAAERIDGGLERTADRVAAEIEGAVTRIETGLSTTRGHVTQEARRADPILKVIKAHVAGPRFGLPMVLAGLIVLVFGMLIESRALLLYQWLWAS